MLMLVLSILLLAGIVVFVFTGNIVLFALGGSGLLGVFLARLIVSMADHITGNVDSDDIWEDKDE